jgi:hypothetical protein
VLNWLAKKQLLTVSREDIRRDCLGQRLDANGTQQLLEKLASAGWLRKREQHGGRQGGRPKVRWEVNPQLLSHTDG